MWGAARVRPGCGRARGTRARVTFVLLPTASAGLGLRGAAAPAARPHRPLRRVTCQCLSHVLVTVAVTVGGVTVVVVGLPASATPCSQTHPKSPRGCTRPRERGRRHHPSIGYGPHRSYGAPRPSSGGSQKVTLKWLCREKSDFGTRGELEPMNPEVNKSSFLQGFGPLDPAGPGAPVSTRRPAPTHRAVHRPPTPRSEASWWRVTALQ